MHCTTIVHENFTGSEKGYFTKF